MPLIYLVGKNADIYHSFMSRNHSFQVPVATDMLLVNLC